MPLLSLVIPCYRESSNLPGLDAELERLREHPELPDLDVVLVDDGSPDDTFEVATSLAAMRSDIRVISFSRNFGKEAAMLAGLRAARGDAVVIMDADLQHPPDLVLELYRRLELQGGGQVVARRNRVGEPALRSGMSRLYYRAVNGLIDVELQDGVGDFRILSRSAVDALLSMSERNRFSKGLFSWIGFPVSEVEYSNVRRAAGESSWTFRALLNYGLDGVISFNDRPLRKLTGIGVLATAIGLGYMIFLLADWLRGGVDAPGYITTIAVVTMFGGVQLLSLALMGEYIGRIYSEVKARPHYIVAQDIGPFGSER